MIIAIVITYEPDIAVLQQVLDALRSQTSKIIVVDNGSKISKTVEHLVKSVCGDFLPLSRNLGIGTAQNRGIENGFALGADDILLMDQDTVLETGAVAALVATRSKLQQDGVCVGSIGPLYRNSHDGSIAAVWRANGRKLERVETENNNCESIEADFVIASGSLLSAKALHTVGLMDELLFIDLVDLEWGFRASKKGYRHFVCRNACMHHTLGAGQIRFFRRNITRHAPIRNYYWVRNAVTLSRRDYVPFAWKRYFLTYVPRFLVFYTLFADARPKRLRLMLCGIKDAAFKRGGDFNER